MSNAISMFQPREIEVIIIWKWLHHFIQNIQRIDYIVDRREYNEYSMEKSGNKAVYGRQKNNSECLIPATSRAKQ